MVPIDTNILVRYLVNDDARQAEMARTLIDKAIKENEQVFIPIGCLLECVWVLKSVFHFSRAALIEVVEALLSNRHFKIHDEDIVQDTFLRFRKGKADFSEYLSSAYSLRKYGKVLITFDRACTEKDLFEQLKY
jgi:predicted nucleic-acid-binding protein